MVRSELAERAEADYYSGMKYKDIADKYGVSLDTVKSWKTRHGWDRKSVHTKRKKVCTQTIPRKPVAKPAIKPKSAGRINNTGGGNNGHRRADREGTHRTQFEANRKIILATQSICAICGQPVDKTLRYPNPMAATVDHIIPLSKGGHPSALDNLQLAHACCNRAKSDNVETIRIAPKKEITNRDLPLSHDWRTF